MRVTVSTPFSTSSTLDRGDELRTSSITSARDVGGQLKLIECNVLKLTIDGC